MRRIKRSGTIKLYLELWSNDQFNYGKSTQIDTIRACPLVIESKIFLFGGNPEKNQITEVYPGRSSVSRRILNLPFDFYAGSCTYHNGVVYLCFDDDEYSLCRRR